MSTEFGREEQDKFNRERALTQLAIDAAFLQMLEQPTSTAEALGLTVRETMQQSHNGWSPRDVAELRASVQQRMVELGIEQPHES